MTFNTMKFKEENIRIIDIIVKYNKQGLAFMLFLAKHLITIYTIIIVSYGILFYILNSPCLCDGESLDELSSKLTTCIVEYNKLYNEYIHYDSLLSQAIYRPEKNDIILEYLSDKKISTFLEMSHKLNNIRCIEYNVKGIKPDFISTVKKELHEYF